MKIMLIVLSSLQVFLLYKIKNEIKVELNLSFVVQIIVQTGISKCNICPRVQAYRSIMSAADQKRWRD